MEQLLMSSLVFCSSPVIFAARQSIKENVLLSNGIQTSILEIFMLFILIGSLLQKKPVLPFFFNEYNTWNIIRSSSWPPQEFLACFTLEGFKPYTPANNEIKKQKQLILIVLNMLKQLLVLMIDINMQNHEIIILQYPTQYTCLYSGLCSWKY